MHDNDQHICHSCARKSAWQPNNMQSYKQMGTWDAYPWPEKHSFEHARQWMTSTVQWRHAPSPSHHLVHAKELIITTFSDMLTVPFSYIIFILDLWLQETAVYNPLHLWSSNARVLWINKLTFTLEITLLVVLAESQQHQVYHHNLQSCHSSPQVLSSCNNRTYQSQQYPITFTSGINKLSQI